MHFADQLDAAARDQRVAYMRLAEVWKRSLDPDIVMMGERRAPSPLMRRVGLALLNHDAQCCPHLAGGPRPAYVNLALPGPLTVLCSQCIGPATLAYAGEFAGTREEMTCDGCGTHEAAGVRLYSFTVGPLMVFTGLCDDCMALEEENTKS